MRDGGVFAGLLRQYGQEVELCREGETAGVRCKAFVQPVLEHREQALPTPLGQVRQDRWLYLGGPAYELAAGENCYVLWQGQEYEAVTAQPVYWGDEIHHWWAILRRRDRGSLS